MTENKKQQLTFTETQINDMKSVLKKSVDKSELNKYFLFTQDPLEKAKVYRFCFRFLKTMNNLIEEKKLNEALTKLIDENNQNAKEIITCLNSHESGGHLRKYYVSKKINNLIDEENVNLLIDLFALLTDRVSYLEISKIRGIILEGKSGKEAKNLFGDKKEFKEV